MVRSGRWSIRDASISDAEAIARLQRVYYAAEGYRLDEGVAEGALRSLLDDPRLGRVWVVEAEERVVGYAALTFGYSLEYGGRDGFVDEMYVDQALRRLGVGREALRRMEEVCVREGVKALHLEVERDNEGAYELYRRASFSDGDRHLMTKRLDPEGGPISEAMPRGGGGDKGPGRG